MYALEYREVVSYSSFVSFQTVVSYSQNVFFKISRIFYINYFLLPSPLAVKTTLNP